MSLNKNVKKMDYNVHLNVHQRWLRYPCFWIRKFINLKKLEDIYTVVNWACYSINRVSPKITSTVPLKYVCVCLEPWEYTQCWDLYQDVLHLRQVLQHCQQFTQLRGLLCWGVRVPEYILRRKIYQIKIGWNDSE